MLNLQINLLKQRQRSNPAISLWRRRLALVAVVLVVLLVVDAGAIFFARMTILVRAKTLQNRRARLRQEIEKKKDIEGLYLTLLSRLSLIEAAQQQKIPVELLPEVVVGLLPAAVRAESIVVDNDELRLALFADNPRAVEAFFERLSRYQSGRFALVQPIVETTSIDAVGRYALTLRLSLEKSQNQ